MQVVRVHEYGGPEVLQVEEVAPPAPGPGRALVRVEVSGVNFFDIRQRTGDAKVGELPLTLGMEGAGVIEALGPDTDDVQVGDRVAWHWQQGSYATHVAVPATDLTPIPDGVTAPVAAAVMLQGLTAHVLGCTAYSVKAGDVCLVHAAAGGLGGLLVQIAKVKGARVIGSVSREDKVDAARDVGADEVIVYTKQELAETARQLTGGMGVDVVYDGVGKETFQPGLDALKPLGYMVVFGQASGAVPPIDRHVLQANGGRYLTSVAFNQFVRDRADLRRRTNDLFGWIESGKVRVRIAATHKLEDAAQAHGALSSRKVSGKLLLDAR